VGGNIGNPLITDLKAMEAGDTVVMELSSFQLEIMGVSPHVAAVLNVTPNHLDRHKTMEAYLRAKANIVKHQGPEDVAVLGADEPNARSLASLTPAQVRYFSGAVELEEGAFLRGDALVLRRAGEEGVVCHREDVRLRGEHNVLNVLAAIAIADAAGVPVAAMREGVRAFTGVEHRLEEVRRKDGVLWVNDSIATAPERVLAALDSFEEPLILLAGGRDKDLPWEEFARRVAERVRTLVLFGEAADLIHEKVCYAMGEGALERVAMVEDLEEAVAFAARSARPGDVVLLSPGGTSFDAYRDFAQRGEHFRRLVEGLDGEGR
jgi:UDP-N-acetylmuramoylalanine--D-glutamate ligase